MILQRFRSISIPFVVLVEVFSGAKLVRQALWRLDAARHTSATVAEALLGLFLGAAVGTPIGIALARYRRAAKIVDPFVMRPAARRARLHVYPLVRHQPFSKVMMSFSMVLFVFILNVTEAIRLSIPP